MTLPDGLRQKLEEREKSGFYRTLALKEFKTDFCSNDYLGLARNKELKGWVESELKIYQDLPWGATGSRLLSGNTSLTEKIEQEIAAFHHSESALLFNSGYAANTGFFSAVPQRGDTIFYDERSHASIKDGIRLSFAKAYPFRHNSLEDLKNKFKHAIGNVYIVVESLYSMDGDFAPLAKLCNFCQEQGAYLVVDEAHSNGLYGANGEGYVQELNLQEQVFARIMTFGKALGAHGAAIIGSRELKEFLVNFSRPFIYTTALPLPSILHIKGAYHLLPTLTKARARLTFLVFYLNEKLTKLSSSSFSKTDASPIFAFRPPTISILQQLTFALQNAEFDIRPIYSPTVPKGKEQLRIVVHAYNTEAEIDLLSEIIAQTLN